MIKGFLKGLKTTFGHQFQKPLTVTYPEQKVELFDRFRGGPYLLKNEDGTEKCVACLLCMRVCPSEAISIVPGERENGDKYPEEFVIDYTRCIFCGYCEEACPKIAIKLSKNFELAGYERDKMQYDKEQLLKMGEGD